MKPEFILIFTCHGSAVKDALQIFRECRDALVPQWGFTPGSVLLEKKLVPNGSFPDNTMAVSAWLAKTEASDLANYSNYRAQTI